MAETNGFNGTASGLTATTKLLNASANSYALVLDGFFRSQARALNVGRSLLQEAEAAQQESLRIIQTLSQGKVPSDAIEQTQNRSLRTARVWLDEATAAQHESRRILEELTNQGLAAQEAWREFTDAWMRVSVTTYGQTLDDLNRRVEDLTRKVETQHA
ncbi:MAG: hypothetical protein HY329_09095 [Chloroflexi bacterium]|nr:hypothetical protein [Chloroflexota bacterium]